jgi:CheY-like chemotaxis protein
VSDLLDVSRIIAGKVRLDLAEVQIAPLIEAAVDSVRPAAEAKGLRVQTALDPHAGTVNGDPERLQQVFWNLLSNAVKFTPNGGRVEVSLRPVAGHVEVAVRDTGQGISPAFLPYVFDRFRQADPSSTRRHGGLGLGLAIVRHMVDLHGGRVRVESGGDGQGATFTVELPPASARPLAAPPHAEPAADSRPTFEPSPVLTGLRVLVVDDDADTIETIRMVLAACGAEVRTATSVGEALPALEAWRPDILVSDLAMPGDDGYALIRRVRALPPDRGGRIPAVALSAYARLEDRLKVLAAGFQMHAPKPIEPAELIAIVSSVAGRATQV